MTTPQTKTIERVLKLLALSKDKGATEAEATLALQKAQELMHDANLTMAELEANGQSAGEGGVREKTAMENKSPYKWHRDLMNQIAELNSVYCAIRMERRGGARYDDGDWERKSATETFVGYTLIGRQANVASTRVMFEYLTATVERLGREWAGNKANWFTTDAFNFKRGCAERVIQRLAMRHEENVANQEREAREAKARQSHPASATGNAVVVVMRDYYQNEVDLNRDFRLGLEPGTTARNRLESAAKYEKTKREEEAKKASLKAQYPDARPTTSSGGWCSATRTRTLSSRLARSRSPRPRPSVASARTGSAAITTATGTPTPAKTPTRTPRRTAPVARLAMASGLTRRSARAAPSRSADSHG